ncbi:hypothetical protein AVEN_41813-1 [Araneus ventricosus]|uniref:Uncharacterized protein n=1 Tax=Araneus ventricosus TaxID=182803 RepID=A0A4Y2AC17_ARAVE|nr:hypothetical protein AVEN_41813-1 [Araneus ventricosus]
MCVPWVTRHTPRRSFHTFCSVILSLVIKCSLDPLWLFPQLADDSRNVFFQPDEAPPHWNIRVRRYLNDEFPYRWIGHVVEITSLCSLPLPRPPDFNAL